MDFLKTHLLTVLTLWPLAGVLLLLFVPKNEHGQSRAIAFVTSLVGLGLSLPALSWFDPAATGMQFEERIDWLPNVGISYHVGIDGIALVLIILTTFLLPIIIASTFGSITHRVKEFMIAMLVLQTAMIGTFAALDMVLFYVFWELMLVPMYLIIGVWGSENRIYAAVKLFIYTAGGSLLMLAAILYLYWQTKSLPGAKAPSFDYADFARLADARLLSVGAQAWLFGAFALAFAIKVPIFPLHTWLPDAHVQAPAAGSVVLAGVLLKMGTFGYVRYAMPLFPGALSEYASVVGWLGVIGIVYGSLMSMAQTDMKKLIAYSSVAHLGFVVVGLMARTQEAVSGAVLQMLNHGISTGALFLLIGYMYDRRHTRDVAQYGGQAKATPLMAAIFLVVTLSSIGLPGTNGFVGEFLILSGTFVSTASEGRIWAILAATGVILGAVYMLTLFQKAYLGPIKNDAVRHTPDLNWRETATLAPLLAMIVLLGVLPQPTLDLFNGSVSRLVERTAPTRRQVASPTRPELPRIHQLRDFDAKGGGLRLKLPPVAPVAPTNPE